VLAHAVLHELDGVDDGAGDGVAAFSEVEELLRSSPAVRSDVENADGARKALPGRRQTG
jgi:hypothetical protein